MAYYDENNENLTFSEWLQAAGHFKNDPIFDGRCAPYTRTHFITKTQYFPSRLRKAWRNGEDPSEYLTPNASIPCPTS